MHRARRRRGEREFHRPQDLLWRGRGARLSGLFADDRFDQGGAPRQGAPRQALLSARTAGKSARIPERQDPHRGKKKEAFKGFTKPKGEPDDLKLIAGITPELEKKLNKLGVIKFEQIANFSDEEIAYVDEALSLDGVIENEDWVSKAVALMAETTADEVPAGEDELEDEEASAEAPKAKKAEKPAKEKPAKKPKKG